MASMHPNHSPFQSNLWLNRGLMMAQAVLYYFSWKSTDQRRSGSRLTLLHLVQVWTLPIGMGGWFVWALNLLVLSSIAVHWLVGRKSSRENQIGEYPEYCSDNEQRHSGGVSLGKSLVPTQISDECIIFIMGSWSGFYFDSVTFTLFGWSLPMFIFSTLTFLISQ